MKKQMILQKRKKIEITTENIKNYDIVQEPKNKGISTIVLDEAHHLKSQWWDSLKKVVEQLENSKIIALTATPPYDSEFSEWKNMYHYVAKQMQK